jgi:hypothetical protein
MGEIVIPVSVTGMSAEGGFGWKVSSPEVSATLCPKNIAEKKEKIKKSKETFE